MQKVREKKLIFFFLLPNHVLILPTIFLERLYLSRSEYSDRWIQDDIRISRFLTSNVLEKLDQIAPKKQPKSDRAANSPLKMTECKFFFIFFCTFV